MGCCDVVRKKFETRHVLCTFGAMDGKAPSHASELHASSSPRQNIEIQVTTEHTDLCEAGGCLDAKGLD